MLMSKLSVELLSETFFEVLHEKLTDKSRPTKGTENKLTYFILQM